MAQHRSAYSRRRAVPAMVLTIFAIATVATAAASTPLASAVSSTVSFDIVAGRTTPTSLGVVSSTYGATPLSSVAQRNAERALDARFVRIPVGYRNGRVTSSAGGSGGTLDVPALVSMYRSWGYRILAVIGGSTTDVDVHAGDPTKIMKALGFDGVDYTAPNEPGNHGLSMADQIALANMIIKEGRALQPGFTLWGPVWSYYDRTKIGAFASALGPLLKGVDYHHYAMGTSSISTTAAMAQTPQYGQEVRELSADLAAKGLPAMVNVDELNLSWRYQDGTAGGNHRFFTAVNTVWMTSALGHILQAGGRGMPYATQNGPLGIMVQAGQVNPDNRPASSPMPAYWGIANWTGAGRWPHFKDTFYATTSSDPTVETFALNNEAGGYNIVVVNKDTANAKNVSLALAGSATGGYSAYRNDPAAPYAAPAKVATGSYRTGTSLALALPPLTVTVLVLDRTAVRAAAPTQPSALRAADGLSAALTWQPPVSNGGLPVTGYRVSRDGEDSTGGGGYSAVLSPTARSFDFSLLVAGSGYHLSVAAVTAAGVGTSWTSALLLTPVPSRALTKLRATAAGPGAVRVSWDPPYLPGNPPITGYRVSRDGRDSTGGGAYATTVAPNVHSFTFTLLASRTQYKLRVQALAAGVTGPVAETAVVTP
jgi:hypothetical protein